jgi:hypothetical protein
MRPYWVFLLVMMTLVHEQAYFAKNEAKAEDLETN